MQVIVLLYLHDLFMMVFRWSAPHDSYMVELISL